MLTWLYRCRTAIWGLLLTGAPLNTLLFFAQGANRKLAITYSILLALWIVVWLVWLKKVEGVMIIARSHREGTVTFPKGSTFTTVNEGVYVVLHTAVMKEGQDHVELLIHRRTHDG